MALSYTTCFPFEIRSYMTPEGLNKQIVIPNTEYSEAEETRPKKLAKAEACQNITRIAEEEERF